MKTTVKFSRAKSPNGVVQPIKYENHKMHQPLHKRIRYPALPMADGNQSAGRLFRSVKGMTPCDLKGYHSTC